ncbi:MAG: PucR family transcriptional regulator ligand-binding domain-containing protein [Clostridiales bacterium]
MSIYVKDILKLAILDVASIVAGKSGMNRSVSWVYTAETLPTVIELGDWLKGGELLFVIGHGISAGKFQIKDLILMGINKKISGIAVFIGPYIKNIPDEVIKICNDNELPLIIIPWEISYVDTSHDICNLITQNNIKERNYNELIDTILFSDNYDVDKLVLEAKKLGFDLSFPHIVISLSLNFNDEILKRENIEGIENIEKNFINCINLYLKNININTINSVNKNEFIIIIKATDFNKFIPEKFLENLNFTFFRYYKNFEINMGIGEKAINSNNIRESYNQSKTIIELKNNKLIPKNIVNWNDIGIYRVFCNDNTIELLNKYYPKFIKPIIDYDKLYDLNLINTLEAYLESNRSLMTASKKLYVHKNTIKYRIDKIKRILDCDFSNSDFRFNLLLELKIMKFLDTQKID